MKMTDRIVADANANKKELDKKRAQYYYDDLNGTEMGMAYEHPIPMMNINSKKSVFDTPDETSINTAKSVFDRTAIFHTNSQEG